MYRSQKPDIEWPRIFPGNVLAGVTTRSIEAFPGKGFSAMACAAFSAEEALTHCTILATTLGILRTDLRFQYQVHGIRIVDGTKKSGSEKADGMVSTVPGTVLCISIADCAAVLLYDPEQEIVAALHSGWRGAGKNITGKALKMMTKRYGTKPKRVLAYISPCAGKQYEVGEEVAKLFPCKVKTNKANGRWMLNMRLHICNQLVKTGVDLQNIEIAPGCTITNDRYHSYRRDKENSGRMVAFIGLKRNE